MDIKIKEIPIAKGFFASECGKIFDSDGVERNYYTNLDGYKTVSVKVDSGKWVTYGVQRLIALTYLANEDPKKFLEVNHIDADKTNNHVSNLEWVTPTMNNKHMILLSRDNNRPFIKTEGEVEGLWDDLYSLSEQMGVGVDELWKCLNSCKEINGTKLRYLSHKDPIVINKRLKVNRRSVIRPIDVLDYKKGVIETYSSMREMANKFGVSTSGIRQVVSIPGSPKIFRGRYFIVDSGTGFDFVSDELVNELTKKQGKEVLVYDLEIEVFSKHNSGNSFITNTDGVSKKAVTTRLSSGSLKPVNGKYIVVRLTNYTEAEAKEIILNYASGLS